MDIRLVVVNVGYILGIFLNIAIASWVIRKGIRKMLGKIFIALVAILVVFQIGHLLGTNTYDIGLSRMFFNLTLPFIFVPVLSVHWALGVLDRVKDQRNAIITMYSLATALVALYIVVPEGYLGLSITKLYFPNYYDAGSLLWLFVVFSFLCGAYFLSQVVRVFREANPILKNRLIYFVITLLFGYLTAAFVFLLAFDIAFDPVWSMFMALYTVPLAYGIVRYELMDISVVAKRALIYGALVALTSLLITAVSYVNIILSEQMENFPLWLIPLVSSFFAVAIGTLVWLRMKEIDVLKYEFITIITHKFRTPLTRIRWSSDELKRETMSSDGVLALNHIIDAGDQLTDLTDALVSVAETERADYNYQFAAEDIRSLVQRQIDEVKHKYEEKKVTLTQEFPSGPVMVFADIKRIQFVIEVLLDNALSYTPAEGRVTVNIHQTGSRAIFSVRDSGMGIPPEDLPMIFTKFFRNARAKLADTEGLGIGLYLSKQIIEKHEGKISVDSSGEGKGATFTVRLPVAPVVMA